MNPGEQKKHVGPIVATFIIVLVLIIAALYLFASSMNQQSVPATPRQWQLIQPSTRPKSSSRSPALRRTYNRFRMI